MNTKFKIAALYSIFSIISTATNIATQELSLICYKGGSSIVVSILFGTGVGLIVKYQLDKKYIFRFCTRNATHDMHTFAIYSAMGIVSTFVFWSFEFGFQAIFETKEMRYAGGVIGLSIGYFIKYQMDKRFVFRQSMG